MNTINNIAKLASSLTEDATAADRVRAHAAQTHFIHILIAQRTAKGMTQKQIAAKMGCDASKISRMESGSDDQLNWGDVSRYVQALGIRLSVFLDNPGLPAAERIKHHVITAHKLLEELAALAREVGGDDQIASKIKEFYGEVLLNFLLRFTDCCGKLPKAGPITISSGPEKAESISDPAPEDDPIAVVP